MSELLTNIGTILTNLINWFTQIGSYLITNPIFIIILSVAIFSVLFYNLKGIIQRNKANRKYKSMENWDIEDFDRDFEEWKKEHPETQYDENGYIINWF